MGGRSAKATRDFFEIKAAATNITMKINKEETKIVGHWIFNGSNMIADENCKRIDWLRRNYLKLIATDESGWLNLYQDPDDKRYWQINFEQGEMQGGGPPSLILISELEANEKYDIYDGDKSV